MVHPKEYPVILIGAGPACITAAIQLKRSNVSFLMIGKDPGGLIANANLIENLLGFPKGISGEKFVSLILTQLKNHSITILEDEVLAVDYKESKYFVKTKQNQFICKKIIIGTGTLPRKMNISGESLLFEQRKLFYEIKNTIHIKQPEKWIIIGSGDAAYDYALNLASRSNHVTVLQRSESSKALPLLINRIQKISQIQVKCNISVLKLDRKSSNVVLTVSEGHQETLLSADRVLVAIGRHPNTYFLSNDLSSKVDDLILQGSLFMVGDVKNKSFRQVSIAMGDGLWAAMTILGNFK
ncbi:NAD(P)/FAD-dependent oxidoreductase [Candidatus Lokiarchaeum ossiferum]|uniref:NAD(P)/FAD-dependent oxidoreductase n=1 Tax=Candidatus Lokiarchaeum ossiferum TaxID=2951803 RepID=UPI00352EB3AE